MLTEHTLVGTLKAGVIVPEKVIQLAEGTQVTIVLPPVSATPEHNTELDIWQQAHRESETLLAKWEHEAKDENGWPLSFFEDTYGSLEGDPVERLPQGDLEEMVTHNTREFSRISNLPLEDWEL